MKKVSKVNAQQGTGNGDSWISPSSKGWLFAGLATLIAGFLWTWLVVVDKDSSVFKADSSFAALAGFTVLALALERLSEAVLAPWWGTVKADDVKQALARQSSPVPSGVSRPAEEKTRLGVTDLTRMLAASRAAPTEPAAATPTTGTTDGGEETEDETTKTVESAWEKAVAARPTLILPAAAIATVLAGYMHLFLFHSISGSGSGLPDTKLAFAVDALLTGLALAGGAKPFHDLTESLAAKSTSNKQEAAAKSTGPAPAT